MTADRVERESAGVIASHGRLVGGSGQAGLAGRVVGRFRQRIALVGGLSLVRLEIEIDLDEPPAGPVLEEHAACRFAWNENDDPELRRSLHGESIVTERTRFTAPHFIEIGDARDRTVILTGGLPWHLRGTPHTLDSILLAAGERRGRWQLVVGLGIERPREVALAALRDVPWERSGAGG